MYVADVSQFEQLMNWGLSDDLETPEEKMKLATRVWVLFFYIGFIRRESCLGLLDAAWLW